MVNKSIFKFWNILNSAQNKTKMIKNELNYNFKIDNFNFPIEIKSIEYNLNNNENKIINSKEQKNKFKMNDQKLSLCKLILEKDNFPIKY